MISNYDLVKGTSLQDGNLCLANDSVISDCRINMPQVCSTSC